MMLKKQTVWLLTMLSLLIVLSVYYMTSPGGDQVALINDDNKENAEETSNEDSTIETNVTEGEATEVDANGNPISSTSTDDLFTQLRLEIQDMRSQQKEQFNEVLTSSSATAAEKNEAMEKKNRLEEVQTKEAILEKVIQSEKNYSDVLVRAEENVVKVTVKADEHSGTEANHIMQMVRDEFGEIRVEVDFQPSNT
ncbi:SpoIIIAH-like family protein [Virgibacillus sp. MSP4-1]|uniref:SpoIIIAH-like family protein n=1 Tax=Virgibacillus sp. MSP4-1 TaxID=2700081 RepID=UPI00039D5764|nr:SpoIIIAH-like family protein [Virgibacillus sp. MSP4-1]QHS22722.1 SpoIIIAH-like family protein [Virgibacillus sp. MSP4-1]